MEGGKSHSLALLHGKIPRAEPGHQRNITKWAEGQEKNWKRNEVGAMKNQLHWNLRVGCSLSVPNRHKEGQEEKCLCGTERAEK